MPLRYVFDENLRGPLWHATEDHNSKGTNPLDGVRVGDLNYLPLRSRDPEILAWAENEERILIPQDRRTLPQHLTDHFSAGLRSPGIFILRDQCSLGDAIAYLEAAAYASDPSEWEDRISYIP